MNEELRIMPDDYKEIQQFNWDGQVKLADDRALIELGEMCPRYLPCPICRKCGSKASHLFEKCTRCSIPLCVHTDKQKNMMIKRANFSLLINQDAMDALDEMAADVRKQHKQLAGVE